MHLTAGMLTSPGVRLRSGWSGGQYSLCRVFIGVALAVLFLRLLPEAGGALRILIAPAVTGAVFLAAGWRDRAAAILGLVVLGIIILAPALAGTPHAPLDARTLVWPWLLLAHLFVPAAPYGSMAARGRVDPAGGWHLPAWIPWAHRAALLLLIVRILQRGAGTADVAATALLALLAFDPAWIPSAAPRQGKRGGGRTPETLFYDGACGLCHRAVRFLLAEDQAGRFRFATLQGRSFRKALPEEVRTTLPDSLVLLTRDGRVLTRARAVRHALAALGGDWRALAALIGIVPPRLADHAYDGVARLRHQLFRRPAEACPITPPALRERFLAD